MTWSKTKPSLTTRLRNVPEAEQENFSAIEAAFDVEHATLTSGASGSHMGAGIVFEGTTAEINALTSVPSGAIAWDTTVGALKYYTGAAWKIWSEDYWSRVRAYRSSNTALSSGSSGSTVIFDVESYDTLADYDHETGIFTARVDGEYLIVASIGIEATGAQVTSDTRSPTGDGTVEWATVGSSAHYANVDEYPTPNEDTDYNTSCTSGDEDILGFDPVTDIPTDSSGIVVSVALRVKGAGCMCHSACYGDTACSCDSKCDGYTACSCDEKCYEYSACSCDAKCYEHTACSCDSKCDGYAACSCDSKCDGDTACSCDSTCDGYTACSCDNKCYSEGSCTCNLKCYGDSSCSCDSKCYGFSCTCNATCYLYNPCTCDSKCFGYTACSTCNNTCYTYTACSTCDSKCYGYVACTCNNTCHGFACSCNSKCYGESCTYCYLTIYDPCY